VAAEHSGLHKGELLSCKTTCRIKQHAVERNRMADHASDVRAALITCILVAWLQA
jgi:hypothetical protein